MKIKIKYFVTIDLKKIRLTCYLKLYLTISQDTQNFPWKCYQMVHKFKIGK